MSTNWKVSGWISSCCTLHIEVCLGKMLGCMAQILISLNQWFPPTVCCSSFTIYQIELWRMWVEKQKPIHIFLLPFSEISICNSWCHLSNHCVLNSFLFFFLLRHVPLWFRKQIHGVTDHLLRWINCALTCSPPALMSVLTPWIHSVCCEN